MRLSKAIIISALTLAMSQLATAAAAINGAGATFPYPLYSKWFSEYQKINPEVQINYQSIGSGGGIRQLMDKTIDFGASDAPMTNEQLSKAPSPIVHIPTVLGAVAVTYNLPGTDKGLKLTAEALADIFLGKIVKWNDPKIISANPGVKLPDTDIMVVHRSDGSGTSAIFTDYLSKVSPEWKNKAGTATSVNWPVGLGGKGNEGVAGQIKQIPGAIGYVELVYALNNKLPYASIKNKTGAYVMPDMKSVTAAASGTLKSMPADYRVSIANAEGKGAYPISGFTYLLVYKTMPDADKAKKITAFIHWALTDGQKFAEPLYYAPLPKALVSKVEKTLKEVK
jgi:phosphate transport system substrate-binding protein